MLQTAKVRDGSFATEASGPGTDPMSAIPQKRLNDCVAAKRRNVPLGDSLLRNKRRARVRNNVAVGTCVSSHAPRPDPYVRLSRIRLPPRVYDGKCLPYTLSACVTRAWRCVQCVLCWCAFPLAPALRSTYSAAFAPADASAASSFALFAGFIATMTGSDFSGPCIIGSGSSPSRCGPPYSAHNT